MNKCIKDLTNLVFGRLRVIKQVQSINQRAAWKCICECGVTTIKKSKYLLNGDTRSCGCLSRQVSSLNAKKANPKSSASQRKDGIYFNGKKHPLYDVWKGIKQRCLNPKNKVYRWYGAKGISICSAWMNNAAEFIRWGILNGWKPHLQIDRINSDGSYSPDNCQFLARSENVKKSHKEKRKNYEKERQKSPNS